ncbi:MAG: alpha-E domain-containing protein, partial [Proteobacteria bacterium]|nr:alpha-E domain-containing protein [Pseudomonadota bacterium]
MLSRRAKLTYWMSRYLERSNFTSRLLISTNELQIDLYLNDEIAWKPLLSVLGLTKDFTKVKRKINEKNIMKYFISEKINPSSIISCLQFSKENSLIVRDRLPEQSVIKLNELFLSFNKSITKNLSKNKYLDLLRSVIQGSQNFMYSTDLEMQRNMDYQFLRLGRFIERSDMMVRILQTQTLRSKEHNKDYEYLTLEWINILKSISAFQAYRQYSNQDISISDIINFFLKTETFPRSVMWNLNQIERAIYRISNKNELLKEIKEIKKNVKKYKVQIDKLDKLLIFLAQIIKKITLLD